ncbi:MAG: hypothetical protein ABI716_02070 [Candidatus Saccharibacteria bacterium]
MDDHGELPIVVMPFWQLHRFLLLLIITISIALFLVGTSMALYASSGAAQLDLSRPGYRAISSQAIKTDNDFEVYPSAGQMDQSAIDSFRALYNKQSSKAKAIDAFSGDPLNPDVLEISTQAKIQ